MVSRSFKQSFFFKQSSETACWLTRWLSLNGKNNKYRNWRMMPYQWNEEDWCLGCCWHIHINNTHLNWAEQFVPRFSLWECVSPTSMALYVCSFSSRYMGLKISTPACGFAKIKLRQIENGLCNVHNDRAAWGKLTLMSGHSHSWLSVIFESPINDLCIEMNLK